MVERVTMEERPFKDKQQMPDEVSLRAALGSRFNDYLQLTLLANSYSQAWNFSKSSGWMLKVFNHQKALFYLIPLINAVRISLAIREKERDILLEDHDLSELHEKITSAKQYVEGFALQFEVNKAVDLPILIMFLKKLMVIRQKRG
jgi:hypothetical protein